MKILSTILIAHSIFVGDLNHTFLHIKIAEHNMIKISERAIKIAELFLSSNNEKNTVFVLYAATRKTVQLTNTLIHRFR